MQVRVYPPTLALGVWSLFWEMPVTWGDLTKK